MFRNQFKHCDTIFFPCLTLCKQYNIQNFETIIFFKYRTRQIKTTETNKKLLILIETVILLTFFVCFCSFDLSCSILEKDNFILNLSCLDLICFDLVYNASSLTCFRSSPLRKQPTSIGI